MPFQAAAPGVTVLLAVTRHRNAALLLGLANVGLGALIGLSYLDGLPLADSARLWLFAHLGLVSSVATLALIPFGVAWLLARFWPSDRATSLTQASVWTLFHIALVIDSRVWGLFRYHFNSAAWNLITSKGSEDSYRLGPRIWIFAFGLAALLFVFELSLWKLLHTRRWRVRLGVGWALPSWVGAGFLLAAFCVEKGIYAKADLERDGSVDAVSRALPLYPRLQVSEFLPEPLSEGIEPAPRAPVAWEGATLRYPVELPSVASGGPRPNVLVLVIDSWRRDMLTDEVTPEVARFARCARRFEQHLSGGNGTRFGVFSLLYGLHGSYWWPVLQAERSPALLDELAGLGYELRAYSAASMDYPEFRRTAWSRMPADVYDDFGEARQSERDALATQACIDWWRTRDRSRPYFAFVLLDSAHQKYDFPEADAAFTPYAREIDYLEMAGSRDLELVELVRNRYRNALRHADAMAGRLLAELESTGVLDETWVVVTGDHGEEFAENGYWGHTGNFTAEQVAVPFVLRGPGIAPGVEARPTSHADFPATVLELLGADPALRSRWCNGGNLLAPSAARPRVVAGWEELGLWTGSGIFRLPREPSAAFRPTVCDARWRLLADQREAFEREAPALAALVEECSRFLELPEPAAADLR